MATELIQFFGTLDRVCVVYDTRYIRNGHGSFMLLYEAIEDERAEVCFVFRNAHSVLHVHIFSTGQIAPEKALHRCCNKPVTCKVPLTLGHYGKYCTWAWSRGKYSTWLHLVLY